MASDINLLTKQSNELLDVIREIYRKKQIIQRRYKELNRGRFAISTQIYDIRERYHMFKNNNDLIFCEACKDLFDKLIEILNRYEYKIRTLVKEYHKCVINNRNNINEYLNLQTIIRQIIINNNDIKEY